LRLSPQILKPNLGKTLVLPPGAVEVKPEVVHHAAVVVVAVSPVEGDVAEVVITTTLINNRPLSLFNSLRLYRSSNDLLHHNNQALLA
jgi:mannitol/fructose-specific phosphotransferase system IIA component